MPVLSLALSWESTCSQTRVCVPLLRDHLLFNFTLTPSGWISVSLIGPIPSYTRASIYPLHNPRLSPALGSLFISILPQGSFLSQRRFRGSLRDKSALQNIPLVEEKKNSESFSLLTLKKKKRKQMSLVTLFGISLYLTHVPCYGKRAIITEGLKSSATCPEVWRNWC